MEYLSILKMIFKMPQYNIRAWLMETLDIESSVSRNSFTDAGVIRFHDILPIELWKVRCAIGETISREVPPYKNSLVDHRLPEFDIKQVPNLGYAFPRPNVQSHVPDCTIFQESFCE